MGNYYGERGLMGRMEGKMDYFVYSIGRRGGWERGLWKGNEGCGKATWKGVKGKRVEGNLIEKKEKKEKEKERESEGMVEGTLLRKRGSSGRESLMFSLVILFEHE